MSHVRSVLLALSLIAGVSSCAETPVASESGRVIRYWFAPGAPHKLKLATVVAAKAWATQTGIRFERVPAWNMADVTIVWQKNYGQKDLFGTSIGVPGTLACAYVNPPGSMSYVRVNAARADGWKWSLGDFGRWGKLCALDGVLMHELGHITGARDIPCNPASVADPLGDRENWPTMYGRIWERKLVLKTADYDELKRVMTRSVEPAVFCEEGILP